MQKIYEIQSLINIIPNDEKKTIIKKRLEKINQSQPELIFQTRKITKPNSQSIKYSELKLSKKIIKMIENKISSNQINDDQI
jgi:hypothetical protein